MKRLLVLFAIFVLNAWVCMAQENVIAELKSELADDFMIGNYHEGQKFIVAIPPNGREGSGWSGSAVRISIASKTDANVSIDVMGAVSNRLVKAGEIMYFDENIGINAKYY